MSMLVKTFLFVYFVSECVLTIVQTQFLVDEYGRPRAIAARRGEQPPCNLQAGQTYCETVSRYPYDLIQTAIANSNYDIKKLLVDESRDEGPDPKLLGLPETTKKPTTTATSEETVDPSVVTEKPSESPDIEADVVATRIRRYLKLSPT